MSGTIAGIDGGGTKTIVEIRTTDNTVYARRQYGAFNINSIGETAFRELIGCITDELIKNNCKSVCFGAAGISNPKTEGIIRDTLASAGYNGVCRLAGDHETALEGAVGANDGLVLIAGTGSICFGKTTGAAFSRSGGYGHLIDDGGSAYAIARDALTSAVKSCDGRGEATILKNMLFGKLNISSPSELVPLIYTSPDKKAVAALCPIVVQAAAGGDIEAVKIVNNNIDELVLLVRGVCRQLSLSTARICLLGGLLTGSEYIRYLTIAALRREFQDLYVTEPLADAAAGAAQLAFHEYKNV